MMQSSNRSLFFYNKQNELVTYVDLSEENEVLGYYGLKDNVFTRMNVYRFKEKNKWHTDVSKAKITYSEDVKLFHIFSDGESCCRVIRKNGLSLDPPAVVSKVYSHNEDSAQGATLNPTLIQDWLKKL